MSFRDNRLKFSSTFSNDDHNALYEQQRAILAAQAPVYNNRYYNNGGKRGFPNKRRGSNRRNYNEQRVVAQRSLKSQMTQDDLTAELNRKLFAGTKNQTAEERLEMLATKKAITITVTTRGIGTGVCCIYESLYSFNNVPLRGSIYQLYRIALGVFEGKISIAQRATTIMQLTPDDYMEPMKSVKFVQAVQSVTCLPDQLSSIICDLGIVKCGDRVYIPRLARNRYSNAGGLLPDPVNVCLSNLRETVVSLANVGTPVEYRRAFYRYNPIPGAMWRGLPHEPVLVNPDDICPADYGPEEFLSEYNGILVLTDWYNSDVKTRVMMTEGRIKRDSQGFGA